MERFFVRHLKTLSKRESGERERKREDPVGVDHVDGLWENIAVEAAVAVVIETLLRRI